MASAALGETARIETPEQLRDIARDAEVMRLDLVLPSSAERASEMLWDNFANKPAEARFSGVTTADWEKKWDLMAGTLVEKAKAAGLDAEALRACLTHLDHGRTAETKLVPMEPELPPGSKKNADRAKETRSEVGKSTSDEKVSEPHPYAMTPVAAYLARQGTRPCWIIVCKWELAAPAGRAMLMGHIKVWALDCETKRTVG